MKSTRGDMLYKDEIYHIVGCAMEVLTTLGSGLLEKPYENALVVEMELRNIPHQQQFRFPVFYKAKRVGEYVADLVVYNAIIVEVKVVEKLGGIEQAQLINYLKISGFRVGLLLNFRFPSLQWTRVVV